MQTDSSLITLCTDNTDGHHVSLYNNNHLLDHSHPKMKIGHPFKFRWSGRPSPGMLSTPDILKYKIPVPFAFVPANPLKEAKQVHNLNYNHKQSAAEPSVRPNLLSAGAYKLDKNCQKMVQNYNSCIKNNTADYCTYYANYLASQCGLKK